MVPSASAAPSRTAGRAWRYDAVAAQSVTATLFLAAGVMGLLSVVTPGWPGRNSAVVVAVSVGALICGLIIRSVRQVPYRVCLALTAGGDIAIAAAQHGGGTGGGATAYGALYAVALAAAFLFYPGPVVLIQIVLAAAGQYAALCLSGAGRTAPVTVLLTIGSACATGLVVRSLAALRARAEQDLAWQASHDGLTGLPNRLELSGRWQHALMAGGDISALVLDLRGFKQINDEWGHHYGDAVLVEVGRRLSGLREPAVPARLGGDEFAVLLPGVGASGVVTWAEEVSRLLNGSCRAVDTELPLRATVGGATYRTCDVTASDPDGSARLSSLLATADAAMYDARHAGRRIAT